MIIIWLRNQVRKGEKVENGLKFQKQKQKRLKTNQLTMVRIKRGVATRKKRIKTLRQTKGFKWRRKSAYRQAKDALRHALAYAYRDRRAKKRDFRQLWQTQINAACRESGINYSRFMAGLKRKKISLDRKTLANLAKDYPQIFEKIVEKVKEG